MSEAPRADRAVVEPAKIRDKTDWPRLQEAVRALARAGEAELGEAMAFGQKYLVRGILQGPSRGAETVTVWIVLHGEAVARLRDSLSGSECMTATYRELDTVVLRADIPASGLRAGDLGAVVQVYGPDAVEVEFVTASGRTQALLTLRTDEVRPVRDNDLLAVRPTEPAQGAA